jgi:surface antigen
MPGLSLFDNCNFTLSHTTKGQKGNQKVVLCRKENLSMRMQDIGKPNKSFFVSMILISLILIGCATTQEGGRSKTIIGGLGGAAAGGLLGAALGGDTAGIIAGTLIGGLIGGAVGDRLDAADRREAREAARYSLEKSRSGTIYAMLAHVHGQMGQQDEANKYLRQALKNGFRRASYNSLVQQLRIK